jgi:hypothetical protein
VRNIRTVRLIAMLQLFVTACVAQVFVSLNGLVHDHSGAAIPNAEVTLVMKDASVQRTTRTNTSGEFGFPDIPPGNYEITVSLSGFKETRISGIANVGQAGRIDVELSIQSISEPVTVEAGDLTYEAAWNSWVENSGPPSFNKLETAHTRSDYQAILDLSAFEYYTRSQGIVAKRASSQLLDWLKHQKGPTVRLKVLLVPDPALLPTNKTKVQNFDVSLSKMRQYLHQRSRTIPADPLADLAKNPELDFRFGHTLFEFHTGDKEGLAYIGLSIWASDIPLDEVVIPVCISDKDSTDDCDVTKISYHGDPLNAVPLSKEKDLPAASLHFFDFGSERAIGVLHVSGDQYLTWTVGTLSNSIGTFVDQILLKNFDKEVGASALQSTGYSLYNLLLPPNDPFASKARVQIEALVAKRLSLSGKRTDAPPLVIRMASYDSESSFFVPLGMVAVPVGDKKYFLGDLFRVLSPLPLQEYRPLDSCISRWVMVMPPAVDQSPKELKDARLEFKDWTNACKGPDCIASIPDFQKWIGSPAPENKSTALLLLGHYEDDSFTFDHSQFLAPSEIQKSFKLPSVAIIDACAAAAPGADRFVKYLNQAGFQSIVATTTTVKPIMAGQYFNLLALQLEQHRGEKDYTISKAHFDAVQELEKAAETETFPPYGPKALIYSLLGNGSLRLCTIPRNKSTK